MVLNLSNLTQDVFLKKDEPFLRAKIDELIKSGVIFESNSPWRHNVVVVKKADGGSNSRTVFDAFPFPKVEDLLAKLANDNFFSAIDFSQFYHQLPLLPSDREKTAFCVFNKLYEFTRCPFGLKNTVAVYLDDVVVFGVSEEQHNIMF